MASLQEMMYMWNGFSMINKRPELTEGMMQTLVEAERTLLEAPGIAALFQTETGTRSFSCLLMVSPPSPAVNEYTVDDRCVIHMLKGLCLKNQGLLQAAEECFNKVCSR